MLGRWAALLLITRFPYLSERGIASAYSRPVRARLLVGAATAAGGAYLLMGPWGLLLAAITTLVSLAVGKFAAKKLGGGLTGDVYGAASEIGETIALIGAVVFATRGFSALPLWT